MKVRSEIMDASAVARALKRISFEIEEKNKGFDDIILVGIRRRGETLANMISDCIMNNEGVRVPVCAVDITMYRDDLTFEQMSEKFTKEDLPFDVNNKSVIIVDDVIHTGRTVRAAIDAIFSVGRPSSVQLAVLVDRGHRELPIRPDYVGKNIPTASTETVVVKVLEFDGETSVGIEK